jgi:cell division protein ZapA (FtsZ GTPase activity inhibitor)
LKKSLFFCVKNGVNVPNMDSCYEPIIKSKRYIRKISYLHRFCVEIFLCVIDRQLQELNDRFDEVNTELLICMAAFNLANSFAAYNKKHLLKLAEFYPMDFSTDDLHNLSFELKLYIHEMRTNKRFIKIKKS